MPWHPEEQLGTGWALTASATPPLYLSGFVSRAVQVVSFCRVGSIMGSFGVSPRVGPSACRSTPTHGPVTKPLAQRVVAQVVSFCSGWPGKWVRLVIPPKLFAPAGSGAIGGRYFRGGPVVLVVRHVVILPLSEIARGGDSELRRRQWTGRKGVVSSELPVMVRPAAPGYAALASDGMHWTTGGRRPRGTGCGRGIARSSRLLDRLAG